MKPFVWILISFLSGSIPFSVWLGTLFLNLDVRDFGDGNPGATNVIRAGSPLLGIITLMLDVSKSAFPIGICRSMLGIDGPLLIAIALAPLLGHMLSPFLRFRGGKGLAAALGIWIGLTTWRVSLPAVIGVVLGKLIFAKTGWAVMLSMAAILAVLLIWTPDPILLWVWAGETTLLAWSHRQELKSLPELHPRLKRSRQDQS